MDENNPETVFALQYYLNREQYGDRPLVKGQYFNADPQGIEEGKPTYSQLDGKYRVTNRKLAYRYDARYITLFPRMWSSDNEHVDVYMEWGGLKESSLYEPRRDAENNIMRDSEGKILYGRDTPKNPPGFISNLRFFFTYQVGHMYFRYFMWNFAGRQNDIQDMAIRSAETGSVASDRGSDTQCKEDKMPESDRNAPSRNTYYFLPLLLGLFGLIFHLQRDVRNFWVVMLLFIFTGLAIVVYLNQTPVQPRERDYAYTGSFYAFAIWIGLGVMALFESVGTRFRKAITALLVSFICFLLVPGIMAARTGMIMTARTIYCTRYCL
jgi:hypothetical protein